jgi:deazaflavin-dependent oxidoreductase (nitroreductase family)
MRPVVETMPSCTSELTRRGFNTLNAVVRPAVRSGVGNPLPIGAGAVTIETTGRRSGLPRTVPVLATRVGDHLTVSTVRNDSQWLRNIEADNNIGVWLYGRRRQATASVERGTLNTVRIELEPAA